MYIRGIKSSTLFEQPTACHILDCPVQCYSNIKLLTELVNPWSSARGGKGLAQKKPKQWPKNMPDEYQMASPKCYVIRYEVDGSADTFHFQ